MNKDKILVMIGFAQKAHQISSGDANVKAMLQQKRVHLLLIAEDISDRLIEKWQRRAELEEIPYLVLASKLELGLAIGQSPRGILAVLDHKFAETILRYRME